MFVCCKYCVFFSTRSLYEELITRPEEFYQLWSVVVCDLENRVSKEAMTRFESQRYKKKIAWATDSVVGPTDLTALKQANRFNGTVLCNINDKYAAGRVF
jgi:hypothetical protein